MCAGSRRTDLRVVASHGIPPPASTSRHSCPNKLGGLACTGPLGQTASERTGGAAPGRALGTNQTWNRQRRAGREPARQRRACLVAVRPPPTWTKLLSVLVAVTEASALMVWRAAFRAFLAWLPASGPPIPQPPSRGVRMRRSRLGSSRSVPVVDTAVRVRSDSAKHGH